MALLRLAGAVPHWDSKIFAGKTSPFRDQSQANLLRYQVTAIAVSITRKIINWIT